MVVERLVLYIFRGALDVRAKTINEKMKVAAARAIAILAKADVPDEVVAAMGGERPHTRGVVKNPVDHPHGGGEGKSAGGRHPVSPTGQSAKGLKTRDNKRTDKFIIRRRKKKKS